MEREKIILERLKSGVLSPGDLAAITGASAVTIRRDLSALEKRGLIRRAHGCARLADGADFARAQPVSGEEGEKELIARVASEHIRDGDNIFLGAGTTCTLLARHLREKKNLTVMTPNLDAVYELSRCENIRVSILGGEVQVEENYVETLDEYILAALHRLYFDKVFITVNGIDFSYGYSILKQQQLPLYHHLIANSAAFYVIADSAKFNRRAFVRLCDISSVKNVVTVRAIRDRYLSAFQSAGVELFTD